MPSIFDYKHFFDDYCKECSLDLHLSFDMPSDYETACGTFAPASKTVFINAEHLKPNLTMRKHFFCFTNCVTHRSISSGTLRFRNTPKPSIVIGYDGTCYKLVNGHYISANWMAMKITLPTYILVSRTKLMQYICLRTSQTALWRF